MRLRLLLLASLAFFGGVALIGLTQTAEAQPPEALIIELPNSDFDDRPLTNFGRRTVSLDGVGLRAQWEVIETDNETIALRNVATQRYLRSRGNVEVTTILNPIELNPRFQWAVEVNVDGSILLRNVRSDRYLDADGVDPEGYSVDLNRRARHGTSWTTTPAMALPLPTPTPTPTEPPISDVRDITGTVVDAIEASNGNVLPVVGATIRVGLLETTTASDGTFSLVGVPAGVNNFGIDGSTAAPAPSGQPYTDYQNAVTVDAGLGVLDLGTFNATPRTTYTFTVDVTQTTMVGNPDIVALVPGSSVQLEVAPGAAVVEETGQPFTGELSITEVPNCCTPSSMPQFVVDANPLIVTVQPLGITFSPPAPLDLPNTQGYAPGTTVDLWSLNPETGTFEVKGEGQVTTDGLTIETISGGLVMTDWHFFIPTPSVAGQPFWNFSENTFQVVAADAAVSLDLGDAFTDPDGDPLTFSISADGGWGATIDPLNGVVSGPAIEDGGEESITVQASDGLLSDSRSITIQATLEPIYIGPFSFEVPPDGQLVVDFSELYISPDGTPLTYELENGIEAPSEPSASVDADTGVFMIDASNLQFGFYDFSVTATNASGTSGPYLTLDQGIELQ